MPTIKELATYIREQGGLGSDGTDEQVIDYAAKNNPEINNILSTIKSIPKTDEERAKAYGTISEAPSALQQFGQDVLRKGAIAGQSLLKPILQPIQSAMGIEAPEPVTPTEQKISDVAGGVRNLASAELGGGIATKLGGKIIGGMVGGATTGALQPVEEVDGLNALERGKNIGVGAAVGGALGALFTGLNYYRNINKVDKVLYPKAEKEITKAYKTMHKNIEADLKELPVEFPNRTIVGENLYDEVAKYVTADRKALAIIKEIPELRELMRTKVPFKMKSPFEAQLLKNKITNKLSEAAKNGIISAKEYQSAKIAQAFDKDITNAYPEAYPKIKQVYDEANGYLDILDPLRDRAGFKNYIVSKGAKGEGQALQTAASKVLPPDVANELIDYANIIKRHPKITSVLEKTIRPKHVSPSLKRVVGEEGKKAAKIPFLKSFKDIKK